MISERHIKVGLLSAVLIIGALPAQVSAQSPDAASGDSVWGPWQKDKCRPLTVGYGNSRVPSPQIPVPGRGPTEECTWIRQKNDCPKLSSKIRHPIKCFIRYDRWKKYQVNPPPA